MARYANGISPAGCYDMAGNVWEWTDSFYDESKKERILRGGSWDFNHIGCRCADRRRGPVLRVFSVGFRCARTKG